MKRQKIKETNLNRSMSLGLSYGYMIISPYRQLKKSNPTQAEIEKQNRENNKSMEILKYAVTSMGLSYVQVRGGYREFGASEFTEEASLFIVNWLYKAKEPMEMDDFIVLAIDLAREFNQDSVLIYDPNYGSPAYYDKYGERGMVFRGFKINDLEADYYTSFQKGGRFTYESIEDNSYSIPLYWDGLDDVLLQAKKAVSGLNLSLYTDRNLRQVVDGNDNSYMVIGSVIAQGDVNDSVFGKIDSSIDSGMREDTQIYDMWLAYTEELKPFKAYDAFEASLASGEFRSVAPVLGVPEWVIADVQESYDELMKKRTRGFISAEVLVAVSQSDFEDITHEDFWTVDVMNPDIMGEIFALIEVMNPVIYCAYDINGNLSDSTENILYGDGKVTFSPCGRLENPEIDLGGELRNLGIRMKE